MPDVRVTLINIMTIFSLNFKIYSLKVEFMKLFISPEYSKNKFIILFLLYSGKIKVS